MKINRHFDEGLREERQLVRCRGCIHYAIEHALKSDAHCYMFKTITVGCRQEKAISSLGGWREYT